MTALPKLPRSNFPLKIKSRDKSITLTPFVVSQEGTFLEAANAKDDASRIAALTQVVNECILTPGVRVEDLPFYDTEMVFIRLLEHSNGEEMSLNYVCKHQDAEGAECGNKIKFVVDLREFKYRDDTGFSTKFQLAPDIWITFKTPTLELLAELGEGVPDTELLIKSLESVVSGDNTYMAADHTEEELKDFFADVSFKQRKEIGEKFLKLSPRPVYNGSCVCDKCNTEHKIHFEGIDQLFM